MPVPKKAVRGRQRKALPKTHATRRSAADSRSRGGRNRTIMWIVALAVAVGLVAFVPVALLTDQPSFCPSCHGMQPFYAEWQTGKHKDIWCIDCHVNTGYPNRILHKFSALQEVYAQFTMHATYPGYNADVPDSRCLRCHNGVPTKVAAVGQFSHQLHLSRGVTCAKCHPDAGHRVTFASLDAAGVLNAANAPAGTTYVGQEFAGAPGVHSTLPGHRTVPCSNCHDMASLQCSFCHTPPGNHFGADCKLCHQPQVPFAQFTHPRIPAPHGIGRRTCVQCHPNGYTTYFCTCHGGNAPKGD